MLIESANRHSATFENRKDFRYKRGTEAEAFEQIDMHEYLASTLTSRRRALFNITTHAYSATCI